MNKEFIPDNGIDSRERSVPRVAGEVIKGKHITYIRLHRGNNHKQTTPVLDGLRTLGEGMIKHG